MSEHPRDRRLVTDDQLRTYSISELQLIAEDCTAEPADRWACDACAAWMIAQEKQDAERPEPKLNTSAEVWDAIEDINDSWEIALTSHGIAPSIIEACLNEVNSYASNHYGD